MKKLVLLIGLVAFLGYGIAPSVIASSGVSKVIVKDDPPKADTKDAKCDHSKADSKCAKGKDGKDAKCCKGKDGKACTGKCPHAQKEGTSEKSEKTDDKVPVPQK